MLLRLKRKYYTNKSTIGELYFGNQFFCYTLEDKVREDGVKIPGETAIPEGDYSIVLTQSERFNKIMPRLLSVPDFQGILIHPGNNDRNTEGCILVGYHRGKDEIGESKAAFNDLFARIQAAVQHEAIAIEITNEDKPV